LHLVIDSSGFKVYGEGEWKVRLHGWSKRRPWRKLRLAVDEATGDFAVERHQFLGAAVGLAQHPKADSTDCDEQHHNGEEGCKEFRVNGGRHSCDQPRQPVCHQGFTSGRGNFWSAQATLALWEPEAMLRVAAGEAWLRPEKAGAQLPHSKWC
jgi:hypothetical protein